MSAQLMPALHTFCRRCGRVFCALKDEQQSQRDQQLVVRLLLEEKKENEQQQDIAGIHAPEGQLVEQTRKKLRSVLVWPGRG